MSPRVTVLLPVHNGQRYLRSSIESVLAQTFGDLELLVVDDGSTDETPSILAAYTDPRVRVITQGTQQGLATALNTGLAQAHGELIARQDADDVSLPVRIERQVAYLEDKPRTILVGTQATMIDSHGRVRGRIERSTTNPSIRWSLLFDNPFVHSSVLVRRAAIEAAGGYDAAFSVTEDYELWSRLALHAPVANLDQAFVLFRVHGQSTTQSPGRRARSIEENRVLVERNARQVFGGGPISAADAELLSRYRLGLQAMEVAPFVALLRRLLPEYLSSCPTARTTPDMWRTLARQHLTLARALLRSPSRTALRGVCALAHSSATPPMPQALAREVAHRALLALRSDDR